MKSDVTYGSNVCVFSGGMKGSGMGRRRERTQRKIGKIMERR
jgi:hypothetical protein